MAPVRRVAVAQWHIKDLAIEENHRKACEYIRDAAGQGAELVVLPEYHLNGFCPESPEYIHQTETYKPYLSTYQHLAKELGICLVPGTIVERHHQPQDQPQEPGKPLLYNTAYFIAPTGEILSSYRKKNIWHPERPYLTSSGAEPHEVFDTPIGKVGLLICWDLAFPEAFRELVARGAEIIVIPTFCEHPLVSVSRHAALFVQWTGTRYDASPTALKYNHSSEPLLLTSLLTARAFENTCAIIFANAAGGADTGDTFLGLSRVTLPIVGVVEAMGQEEGVCVVDMDLGIARVAEEMYRVREDLGREGWHYVYRHGVNG